jgi:hypothetical protein
MDQNKNQGPRQGEQQSGQRRSRGERNRGEGISNRGMDRELDEQSELPERGRSQSERESER